VCACACVHSRVCACVCACVCVCVRLCAFANACVRIVEKEGREEVGRDRKVYYKTTTNEGGTSRERDALRYST